MSPDHEVPIRPRIGPWACAVCHDPPVGTRASGLNHRFRAPSHALIGQLANPSAKLSCALEAPARGVPARSARSFVPPRTKRLGNGAIRRAAVRASPRRRWQSHEAGRYPGRDRGAAWSVRIVCVGGMVHANGRARTRSLGGPSQARVVSGYGTGLRGGHPAAQRPRATIAPAPLRTDTEYRSRRGTGALLAVVLRRAASASPTRSSPGPADVAEPIHVLGNCSTSLLTSCCASLGEPRQRLV